MPSQINTTFRDLSTIYAALSMNFHDARAFKATDVLRICKSAEQVTVFAGSTHILSLSLTNDRFPASDAMNNEDPCDLHPNNKDGY